MTSTNQHNGGCGMAGQFSPILSTSTETDDQRAAREAYHRAFVSYHTTKKHIALVRLQEAVLHRMKVGA